MANIVISYRREDSKWITGRIFDRLEAHFGVGNVFMDIDNIPIGLDFRDHLQEILKRCDILVAVIGPNWLKADDSGVSRLHDPADWVRIEIAAALEKMVPVVPLLIDGTRMPRVEQLPPDLQGFAFRQAAALDSGIDFRGNIQRLTSGLDRLLAHKSASSNSQQTAPQIFEATAAPMPAVAPNDEPELKVDIPTIVGAHKDEEIIRGGPERVEPIAEQASGAGTVSAATASVARQMIAPAMIVMVALALAAAVVWLVPRNSLEADTPAANASPPTSTADTSPPTSAADTSSDSPYVRAPSPLTFSGDPLEGNWCETIGSSLFPPSQIKKQSDGSYAANFYAINTQKRRGNGDFVSGDNSLRLTLNQTDRDTLEGTKTRSTGQASVKFVRCR
jgi:hypothetical protein